MTVKKGFSCDTIFFRAPLNSIFLIAASLLISATCAEADDGETIGKTELHVISVFDGSIRTGNRIHGPEVQVSVNRAGQSVVLGLGNREAVRWHVEVTPETQIESVILFGKNAQLSEAYVNGTEYPVQKLPKLQTSVETSGSQFREMVTQLSRKVGVDGLASFHSAKRMIAGSFTIDAVQDLSFLKIDHLSDQVHPKLVPAALEPFVDQPMSDGTGLELTKLGFVLTGKTGTSRNISVTLDVPRIASPGAAVMDEERGRLFGLSRGGDSFLYQYNMTSEKWSVLLENEKLGGHSMAYDVDQDRLILGFTRRDHGFEILTPGELQSTVTMTMDVERMPGYADLHYTGGRLSTRLVPIAAQGDYMLARATERRRTRGTGDVPASRTYLVSLVTGESWLVGYQEKSP